MLEVSPNLYVGTVREAHYILSKQDEWRLANVAKTLHLELHGWSSPDKYSPYYIVHETPTWISVNWVDGPNPQLFNYQDKGVNVVKQVLAFTHKSLEEDKKVLITCDQGQSRSPSIALLYQAKVLYTLPDTSFIEAHREFLKIYPLYQPGAGISGFLASYWSAI